MNFFKDNSSKIARLIITHIAMSIFGLALGFSIVGTTAPSMQLVISICCLIFYAVIVYTTMWEFGAKDKPAFDAGRQSNAFFNGLIVSLCAEALFIIIAAAYAISAFFGETSYLAGNICFIGNITLWLTGGFFTGAMSFIESTMKSMALDGSAINHLIRALVYIFGSLFVSLFSGIGYLLGTRDISIIPKKKNTKK